MENASKALLMAGGMLLAMMILVLLVYLATTMTNLAKAEDEKFSAQQIQEFNNGYLAYNKKRMYGTDVITVVNKAIDYNSKLGTSDENYKINIILKLNDNFETTKQLVIQKGNGETEEKAPVRQGDVSLSAGTYQLFEREESIRMNESIINFFNQVPDSKDIDTSNPKEIKTTFTYSGLTNFKKAIFECQNVTYNDEGRINSMTFNQV